MPYLGYVEACLKIPEIKAFDLDVLLLIVPDSAHTQHTHIMLGTLHIDMVIKFATTKEFQNFKQTMEKKLGGDQTNHERNTDSEYR